METNHTLESIYIVMSIVLLVRSKITYVKHILIESKRCINLFIEMKAAMILLLYCTRRVSNVNGNCKIHLIRMFRHVSKLQIPNAFNISDISDEYGIPMKNYSRSSNCSISSLFSIQFSISKQSRFFFIMQDAEDREQ